MKENAAMLDLPADLVEQAEEPDAASVGAPLLGTVVGVSGYKLSCRLGNDRGGLYANAQIGRLVRIATPRSAVFGFVGDLALRDSDVGGAAAIADIDLLGEITEHRRSGRPTFSRGVSIYPVLGAAVSLATDADLATIYARPDSANLCIGTLYQDEARPAYLLSQEFLCKHSAILGTTGSGKSCAVTLILRTLLTAHPNGHIVLLDPHGEYAAAFTGMAEIITPNNLQLPYWLLSFEEITEVLCSRDL